MANKGKMSMLSLFEPVPLSKLTFLTKLEELKSILLESPLKPENLSDSKFDANDCIIQGKPLFEKKKPQNKEQNKQHKDPSSATAPTTTIVRNQEDKKPQQTQPQQPIQRQQPAQQPQPSVAVQEKQHSNEHEETHQKKKVYRKGACAIFFTLQDEAGFDKDAQVWYYKDGKQIIGPVSSYNMDKMAYHRTINGETRVAFKSIDKFVKFSKIQAIAQEHQQEANSQQTAASSANEEQPKQEKKEEQPQQPEKKQEQTAVEPVEKSPATAPSVTPVAAPKKKFNLSDPEEFPCL